MSQQKIKDEQKQELQEKKAQQNLKVQGQSISDKKQLDTAKTQSQKATQISPNRDTYTLQITKVQNKQELQKEQISNTTQTKGNQTCETKQKKQIQYEQQMPDKFYDSDLASVNQKDFMSDNQPPKDIEHERKLLHKQKKLHIYKTIVRVGKNIDKPAPFDQIRLRYKNQPVTDNEGVQQAKQLSYIQSAQFETYNLGKKNHDIQRLVTSMKQGQIALFQIQHLQVSKKSNIKVLKHKQIFVVEVEKWITVIDIDGNKQVLKYILRRGQGPFRVSKYDQITFDVQIMYKGVSLLNQSHKQLKIQEQTIAKMQPIVWKVLTTMKKNQLIKVKLDDYNMKVVTAKWQNVVKAKQKETIHKQQQKQNIGKQQGQKSQQQQNKQTKQQKKGEQKNQEQEIEQRANLQRYDELMSIYEQKIKNMTTIQNKCNQSQTTHKQQNQQQNIKQWEIHIQVLDLISLDDIFMDGKIFKKLLIKGVSTSKPESSSVIYYALKFLDSNKNVLYQDPCFNSDWWEDYGKLDQLGCRKNYLDQYKLSKFLRVCMKRMKPAQVSQIQCRDMKFFKYGVDYQQLKKLWPQNQQFPPEKVYMVVRVYNFTEGKNCFNMQIEEKIQQSRRKKVMAVKLLNEGKIQKAFKRFQNIVSFYNSGQINQQSYEQKISALMNSILCLMKQNKYAQMIPLCDTVLEKPKHGFDQNKMSIKAQGIKVQGNVNNSDQVGYRQATGLNQNIKIIQKCLYRKALALLKIGESKQAIECLNKIQKQNQTEEIKSLRIQAEKQLQNYEQKSKKIFKSMFG